MTPPIMLTVIIVALAAIGGGLLAWVVTELAAEKLT